MTKLFAQQTHKIFLLCLACVSSFVLPNPSWSAQIDRNNLIGLWTCKSIGPGEGELKSITSTELIRNERDGTYSSEGTTTFYYVFYDVPVEWILFMRTRGRWSINGNRINARATFVDIKDRWRFPFYLDVADYKKNQISQEMRRLGVIRSIRDLILKGYEARMVTQSRDRYVTELMGTTSTCYR
jgi:hypothetical protein